MNILAKLRATVLQLIIILVCRIKCYLLLFMVRFDMNAVHIVQFEITVQSAKLFFWQVFLYYYFFLLRGPKSSKVGKVNAIVFMAHFRQPTQISIIKWINCLWNYELFHRVCKPYCVDVAAAANK